MKTGEEVKERQIDTTVAEHPAERTAFYVYLLSKFAERSGRGGV